MHNVTTELPAGLSSASTPARRPVTVYVFRGGAQRGEPSGRGARACHIGRCRPAASAGGVVGADRIRRPRRRNDLPGLAWSRLRLLCAGGHLTHREVEHLEECAAGHVSDERFDQAGAARLLGRQHHPARAAHLTRGRGTTTLNLPARDRRSHSECSARSTTADPQDPEPSPKILLQSCSHTRRNRYCDPFCELS